LSFVLLYCEVKVANENYYVVEARVAVQITEALSVDEAARKAARIIENQYGVNLSNWYLRVFEYGAGEDIGPIAEYFSNPSGSKFRKIDKNIEDHEELIKNEQSDGVE
jgi:hypothetical protein